MLRFVRARLVMLLLGNAVLALRSSKKRDRLCIVRTSGDEPVNLFLRSPSSLAIAFGENPTTVETEVRCLNKLSCDANKYSDSVGNVTDCPACNCNVDDTAISSPSNRMLFDSISSACVHATRDRPVDVLMLGLGGGEVHRHTHKSCPGGTRIRSVELDSRVAGIAERYFGINLVDGASEVVVADAGKEVHALSAARVVDGAGLPRRVTAAPAGMGLDGWDVITVDCFIGHGVTPESCRSPAFVKALRSILKPGGIALQHLWHYSPEVSVVAENYKQTLAQYQSTFGKDAVSTVAVPRDKAIQWDTMVVARSSSEQHGIGTL